MWFPHLKNANKPTFGPIFDILRPKTTQTGQHGGRYGLKNSKFPRPGGGQSIFRPLGDTVSPSRKHKKTPLWAYFRHFTPKYHPQTGQNDGLEGSIWVKNGSKWSKIEFSQIGQKMGPDFGKSIFRPLGGLKPPTDPYTPLSIGSKIT